MSTLSLIIPVFNEAPVLEACLARCASALAAESLQWNVLFIDDGSSDASWQIITQLSASDSRVSGLRLARNFGKEAALTAGLDAVDADVAVVLDADLQDPPELIPAFLAKWREGFDVVYGLRSSRLGESWLKRTTARGFYALISRFSDTPIPRDTGDFRLLSRRALAQLKLLRERNRFMKGLFAWIGLPHTAVPYQRQPRAAGSSKWNYWRLWNFALDGITSFTTLPLRLATYIGALTALFAFCFGFFILFRTLIYGTDLPGYPSMMVTMMFLGGMQLIALGIIGEYLGRVVYEVKQRPIYLVQEVLLPRAAARQEG